MITLDSTLSRIRKQGQAPINNYQLGKDFVEQLVAEYPFDMRRLVSETYATDFNFVSIEKLKSIIKNAIKTKNKVFVEKLASYLNEIKGNPTVQISKSEVTFSATGISLDQALSDLDVTKEQYTSDSLIKKKVDNYILSINSNKAADNKLEDNSGSTLDNIAKISQSIFFLGSAFAQKDAELNPTFTDAENTNADTKSNVIRNIVIASVVLIALGVGTYFILKDKK